MLKAYLVQLLRRSLQDYNDHTDLPEPRLSDDQHGTRCAGEIAQAFIVLAMESLEQHLGDAWDERIHFGPVLFCCIWVDLRRSEDVWISDEEICERLNCNLL